MPGKTVSRPFHACSMYMYKWNEFPGCWSACGFVLTLLPLVWIKQILFLLLAWACCHQTVWLCTALALAHLQTLLSLPLADAVLFAGRATANSFVYLALLVGGKDNVSLLSKYKGELWGCCLLCLLARVSVMCRCCWADPFSLPCLGNGLQGSEERGLWRLFFCGSPLWLSAGQCSDGRHNMTEQPSYFNVKKI